MTEIAVVFGFQIEREFGMLFWIHVENQRACRKPLEKR